MTNAFVKGGVRAVACACGLATLLGADLGGFATSGHRWAGRDVTYYVNPRSTDVSEAAAVSAIQRASAIWSEQSRADVRFVYGGSTTGTSLSMNRKNEVFFRDDSNGSYVAETYWWYDGTGALIDADIVFHEGAYRYFTNSGCLDGLYVEAAAAHEFGHALGLEHSSLAGATMSPSLNWCDLAHMTLESDDIAAVESVYPATTAQAPVAPSGLTVAPSSSDPISSLTLSWSDNAANETGYRIERSTDGASFSQVVQLGSNSRTFTNAGLASATTYFYRVLAFNSTGVSPYSNVASGRTDAAPVSALPSEPLLSVRAYKTKGVQQADLTWSGLSGTMVDVFRDALKVKTTGNDGKETDSLERKGGGSVKYRVCVAGSTVCTNLVTVTF